MISKYTRFKLNRRFRKLKRHGQKHTDRIESQARIQIVRRWQRLRSVRGFVLSWIGIWIIMVAGLLFQLHDLGAAYKHEQIVPGGTYTEGIVGSITNMNPLFALDGPNAAAARLAFNGLLRYDDYGVLVNDLAETIVIDPTETVYTVTLRQDVKWHDGEPLTAEDVIFTFQMIQHPDTRSPLNSSWRSVEMRAIDDKTVEFKLPNSFSPFPHALTTGVVPKHLLAELGPTGLRPAPFNQAPVGTGPFRFSRLDAEAGETSFVANEEYFKGEPQLDRIILKTYPTFDDALQAYSQGLLTALADVPIDAVETVRNSKRPVTMHNISTPRAVYVFYKNSHPILSDANVRRALTMSIDRRQLSQRLDGNYGIINGPLLIDQLGFDRAIAQPGYALETAKQTLDQAGWRVGADGIRSKNGQRFTVDIVTQDDVDYTRAAGVIQQAWSNVGVEAVIRLYSSDELQQSYLKPHNYAALLYGIDLGADPDVFAYWHSSQAAPPGLNLSEYSNAVADDALEAGRTRSDPALRAAKYKTFLEEWRNDVPATALYNRRYIYAHHPDARTFTARRFIHPADRFNNAEDWSARFELR